MLSVYERNENTYIYLDGFLSYKVLIMIMVILTICSYYAPISWSLKRKCRTCIA